MQLEHCGGSGGVGRCSLPRGIETCRTRPIRHENWRAIYGRQQTWGRIARMACVRLYKRSRFLRMAEKTRIRRGFSYTSRTGVHTHAQDTRATCERNCRQLPLVFVGDSLARSYNYAGYLQLPSRIGPIRWNWSRWFDRSSQRSTRSSLARELVCRCNVHGPTLWPLKSRR